jgi:hypothetical protein
MVRYLGLVAAVAVLFGPCPRSEAAFIAYFARLSGPNESPVNSSPGVGTAEVDVDTTAHTLHVTVLFSGLSGTTTAAHIHTPTPAPLSGTAGVATTTPFFAGFPIGVTSGSYDNTLDLTMASSYNPAFVTSTGGTIAGAEAALEAGLAGGLAYLNIHSTVVPGGEIRGFLQVVPEPASLVMLSTGIVGALASGWRARARRRR